MAAFDGTEREAEILVPELMIRVGRHAPRERVARLQVERNFERLRGTSQVEEAVAEICRGEITARKRIPLGRRRRQRRLSAVHDFSVFTVMIRQTHKGGLVGVVGPGTGRPLRMARTQKNE